MRTQADELLVILDRSVPEDARRHIRAQFHVTQQASPSVFVIQRPADPEVLRTHPGVHAFGAEAVPDALVQTLTAEESLFVQAWSQRARMGTKRRPGEGLPWDAAGRTPPDPPPRASGGKQEGN